MARKTHDLQGYTLVVDKILFLSAIFRAENERGYQFNVGFGNNTVIKAVYPDRTAATLARELLVKAIRES